MFASIAVAAACRTPSVEARSRGFFGAYFANGSFSGQPALTRIDPAVMFHFHADEDGLPHPFGADWTAFLRVPLDGPYAFTLVAGGPARVLLDGVPLLERSEANSLEPVTATSELKAGEHVLAVRYVEESYVATVGLWWTPPGERRSVIPLSLLRAATPADYDQIRVRLPRLEP
jgi:hypothetical protein